jgi:hypothetical protein
MPQNSFFIQNYKLEGNVNSLGFYHPQQLQWMWWVNGGREREEEINFLVKMNQRRREMKRKWEREKNPMLLFLFFPV